MVTRTEGGGYKLNWTVATLVVSLLFAAVSGTWSVSRTLGAIEQIQSSNEQLQKNQEQTATRIENAVATNAKEIKDAQIKIGRLESQDAAQCARLDRMERMMN